MGLFAEVESIDEDSAEITIWHMPPFLYTPVRHTWNPFADTYKTWKVHHTATVRSTGTSAK